MPRRVAASMSAESFFGGQAIGLPGPWLYLAPNDPGCLFEQLQVKLFLKSPGQLGAGLLTRERLQRRTRPSHSASSRDHVANRVIGDLSQKSTKAARGVVDKSPQPDQQRRQHRLGHVVDICRLKPPRATPLDDPRTVTIDKLVPGVRLRRQKRNSSEQRHARFRPGFVVTCHKCFGPMPLHSAESGQRSSTPHAELVQRPELPPLIVSKYLTSRV